jgi:DNA-binding FadR family transcriptional regulator
MKDETARMRNPQDRSAALSLQILGGPEPRKAPDHALALLVDAIRAGLFEVGDALPHLQHLAADLGVSHVVARQAVEVLKTCGVVEVRTGRTGGIFLVSLSGIPRALTKLYRVPDKQETIALLHARWLLESEAAYTLCRRADETELRELEAILDRLERTRAVAEFVELTVRFNIRMALAAGNPVLTGFLRDILNRMAIVGLKGGRSAPKLAVIEPGAKIYRSLYEALLANDVAGVAGAIEAHMGLIARIYQLDPADWAPAIHQSRPGGDTHVG